MDTTPPSRTPSPSDVDDEEWAVVVPDLTLMDQVAPQRRSPLRERFHGLRWIVGAGAPWRRLPTNLPPWPAIDEQPQRGLAAGCFERLVHDLRVLIRLGAGRASEPTAVIRDSRTTPSTPERGAGAGYDGAKRRQGTTLPMAVDPLGHLLALHVTPASEQDRAQVGELARLVPAGAGRHVTLAGVDAGDTGSVPGPAAADAVIALAVVGLPAAQCGFVLLPRRWGIERSFGGMARFRRLTRDDERRLERVMDSCVRVRYGDE